MPSIKDIKVETYQQQFLKDLYLAIETRVKERARNGGKTSKFRNSYKGAEVSHLTHTWNRTNSSGDTEARGGLRLLRAGARERARNDDYGKKFLRMDVINVLGAHGIIFQSRVKQKSGKELDSAANERIEKDFNDWGKRKNFPEVTGKLSWRGIQRAVRKTLTRDGEALIRKIDGFKNKYRFALQLLEADHLDETYNTILPNGNEIRMGVELDEWKRPVNYWLLVKHPGDFSFPHNAGSFKRIAIPASEIIHVYDPDRINDTRGIPAMHASLFTMRMLGGYEEAELISARTGAIKSAYYKSLDGDPAVGKEEIEDGNYVTEATPGALDVLPEGYELTPLEWNHPAGNFPPFVKQILRRMASGLGVSYNSLAGDLEKVNYSSIRSGTLEERDSWKEEQRTFIEDFNDPVFDGWLQMWLLKPDNSYSIMDFDRLDQPKWIARTWDWVDPLKDMKANTEGLAAGLMTRTEIFAERGKDFEEQVEIMAEEKKILEAAGLSFDSTKPANNITDDDVKGDPEEIEEEEIAEEETTVPARSNGKNRGLA